MDHLQGGFKSNVTVQGFNRRGFQNQNRSDSPAKRFLTDGSIRGTHGSDCRLTIEDDG
jgi:hypothetical protein